MIHDDSPRKDVRVIFFFEQLNPPSPIIMSQIDRFENKERERIRNFPRRFSAYPWPWPRFSSRALSPLLLLLPTRSVNYVKGRPLVPCSRKVRSMILRAFPLEGRCYVRQRKKGRLFGEQGEVMVEGPWVGLRTCRYTRQSQGSGPIRVRRPRRTDRSHTRTPSFPLQLRLRSFTFTEPPSTCHLRAFESPCP